MNLKVIKIIGNSPGKTVSILAGIHGNETPGIEAINKFSKISLDRGIVYLITCSLEAIKQNKRFIEINLNRCFFKKQPFGIKQTFEGRTAREIIPYLDKADSMLDIHASASKKSLPFVICDKSQISNAQIFNSEIVVYNFDEFEPGSTEHYVNSQKKQGFGFECGCIENSETIEVAEEAILNFLAFNGCIRKKLKNNIHQKILKITFLYKNKFGSFKKSREFADFEILNEKTLIGIDGSREVYVNKEDIVLFVRDRERINEECFLIAKEEKELIKRLV